MLRKRRLRHTLRRVLGGEEWQENPGPSAGDGALLCALRGRLHYMAAIQRRLEAVDEVREGQWRTEFGGKVIAVGVLETLLREYHVSYLLNGRERARTCGTLQHGGTKRYTAPTLQAQLECPSTTTNLDRYLCVSCQAARTEDARLALDAQPELTQCTTCLKLVQKRVPPFGEDVPCGSPYDCDAVAGCPPPGRRPLCLPLPGRCGNLFAQYPRGLRDVEASPQLAAQPPAVPTTKSGARTATTAPR